MILMVNRIFILVMVMMHIGLLQAMLVKVVFIALMFFVKILILHMLLNGQALLI